MNFIEVKDVKLGNMRKAVDWTVFPSEEVAKGIVTIQSDNRIARVDLNAALAILSNGKGGHQGFLKLLAYLGAKTVPVSAEVVSKIRQAIENCNDCKRNNIRVL